MLFSFTWNVYNSCVCTSYRTISSGLRRKHVKVSSQCYRACAFCFSNMELRDDHSAVEKRCRLKRMRMYFSCARHASLIVFRGILRPPSVSRARDQCLSNTNCDWLVPSHVRVTGPRRPGTNIVCTAFLLQHEPQYSGSKIPNCSGSASHRSRPSSPPRKHTLDTAWAPFLSQIL